MTYQSSNGAMALAKPLSSSHDCTAKFDIGLARHPLLTATDQVSLLREIDISGSASVGTLMAVLGQGHADPVGAILAMLEADLVSVDLPTGILDEHARIARIQPLAADDDTSPDDDPEPHAPQPIPSPSDPQDPEDGAAAELPVRIQRLEAADLVPDVLVGAASARRGFASLEELQRPGVYILLSHQNAYVGMGVNVGRRVASGSQPISDVDSIITITEKGGGLSEDDAQVLERIIHTRVSAAREVRLVNSTPNGASVTPQRYAALNAMAALACESIARNGYLFLDLSPRMVLAGPRAETGQLAPPRPFNAAPDQEVMEVSFGENLSALSARHSETEWLLLRGSDIRLEPVASANASASYHRAALLHSGIIELAPDGRSYVLARDILFGSPSAALHFVLGSKGQGRGGWKPIDPDGGYDPNTERLIAA
ncbi:protein of unknown function [Devosia lucknowensis]|uniref:GIY-YIG nuclease family protein n=1 Tax=Devosia lucknowensis TaxID=1096929 RepID=A0A1Y6GCN5_9HYPH|nr:DUF4357 domain-containing protein [Devosia lucknowensis]SMQ85550.1 protein of unknown function [Devosia lucknowensis]